MSFELTHHEQQSILSIKGSFVRYEPAGEIERLIAHIRQQAPQTLVLKNDGIQNWDSSLVVVLYDLIRYLPEIKVNTDSLPDGLRRLLQLAFTDNRNPPPERTVREGFLERLGGWFLSGQVSFHRGIAFLETVGHSLKRWVKRKAVMRSVDFWAALQDCGPQAVGIVSLISFMVGLILAFVGAIQLKSFGAQIYVASLVTIGMTRIMGAIMIGVIMAGRTGASYAATIGTMQVNEELDALQTMGIPKTDFLVLPRLLSLVLAMPILVILADFMGIVGGATVGVLMLGLSPEEYMHYSVNAFNLTNFNVGLFHGLVFGIIIALCGCYFGLFCGRNSDSVGIATTRAVVYAIVWMIVMTGFITLGCEVLGI